MEQPPEQPSQRPRGPDRRKRPTPMLSRYTILDGRRVAGRRTDEVANVYVDVYSVQLVALLLLFFTLTVIDSVSTLVYLGKGDRMTSFSIYAGKTGDAVVLEVDEILVFDPVSPR